MATPLHPAQFGPGADSQVLSPLPPLSLITGGARSGKSAYGEALIKAHPAAGSLPLYLATAEAMDKEMAERIRRHRSRRGAGWETIEEPLDIAGVLKAHAHRAILLDCLTLWLSNLLAAGHDPAQDSDRLVEVLGAVTGPVVIITNEVGQGIVPENELARRFRDEAGLLNQSIAAIAAHVVLMAAGLPMTLKYPAAAATVRTVGVRRA
ncbi:MAG: bifunctional adenosylcobinamide kinase/adenosylcobinamide-phosphate guanylyltransferase [Alphaproteobacteria bacterium]